MINDNHLEYSIIHFLLSPAFDFPGPGDVLKVTEKEKEDFAVAGKSSFSVCRIPGLFRKAQVTSFSSLRLFSLRLFSSRLSSSLP